jgi:hypothetical protein
MAGSSKKRHLELLPEASPQLVPSPGIGNKSLHVVSERKSGNGEDKSRGKKGKGQKNKIKC